MMDEDLIQKLNRKGRQSYRRKNHDYQWGWYFVTIDVLGRQPLFGSISDGEMHLSKFGEVADSCWRSIRAHFPFVELDVHQIMPDHVHGILFIDWRKDAAVCEKGVVRRGGAECKKVGVRRGAACCAPTDPHHRGSKSGSLGTIVRSYKSAVTNKINALRNSPGEEVWQRNFHDHFIHDEQELERIRDYIRENPKRWEENA